MIHVTLSFNALRIIIVFTTTLSHTAENEGIKEKVNMNANAIAFDNFIAV